MKKGTIIDFELRIVKIGDWVTSKHIQEGFSTPGQVKTIEMVSESGAKYFYHCDINKKSCGNNFILESLLHAEQYEDKNGVENVLIDNTFVPNSFNVFSLNNFATTLSANSNIGIRGIQSTIKTK